jgi:hypothetical protein
MTDTVLDTTDLTRAALAKAAAGELLGPTEMAAIFGIGASRFGQLNRAGAFDAFKVRPAIGPRCYSGVLVHRYVSGEAVYEPTFGRKRMKA